MTDIFISYSSKDRQWVEVFAGLLEARGYTVWWDTSLLAGSDFQRTIRKKLKEAKCVIVIWTEHSVESMWVRAEVDHAARRNVLVPIQLRDAELPMPFNIMHAENFRDWRSSPEEVPFQRLLRAIGQHVVVDEVSSAELPRSAKLAATAIEQTEKPVVQAIRPPVTPAKPVAETTIEKPAVVSKPKPKQRQTKSKPDNILQRFGNKVWVALSALLVFGLVYAVNNTGEVWRWLQSRDAEAVVADVDEAVHIQKPLKSPEVNKEKSVSVVAAPEPIGKVVELEHGMELVKIPHGTFQMGSEDGTEHEKPVHTVNIANDFWIGKTEVTFEQYDAYAVVAGKEKPYLNSEWGARERLPVMNVSREDAHGFVKWLSEKNAKGMTCRLPSEAEWEYAARAKAGNNYFWGNQIGNNKANCNGCGSQWDDKQIAPVASFAANAFGLYDMHGNVWEWMQDGWNEDYEGAPLDGVPRSDDGSGLYVLRGGSWLSPPEELRSTHRYNYYPDSSSHHLGFRVVCFPRSVL